jgi:hypothetical protein
MSGDGDGAIQVMQDGLKPERSHSFAQADTLVRSVIFVPTQLVTLHCFRFHLCFRAG